MIENIDGIITGNITLDIAVISGAITSEVPSITGSVATIEYDKYEGDYTFTPNFDGVILPTKDKVSTQDITVEKIPVYKTENVSGGNTVVIGG